MESCTIMVVMCYIVRILSYTYEITNMKHRGLAQNYWLTQTNVMLSLPLLPLPSVRPFPSLAVSTPLFTIPTSPKSC